MRPLLLWLLLLASASCYLAAELPAVDGAGNSPQACCRFEHSAGLLGMLSLRGPPTLFKALPLAAALVAVAAAAAVVQQLVTAAVCSDGAPWASSLRFVDSRR